MYKSSDAGKTWVKLDQGDPEWVSLGRIGLDIYRKKKPERGGTRRIEHAREGGAACIARTMPARAGRR